MDKLLKDLSKRLPYCVKGRLDVGTDCELVGISLKDPENPTLEVRVPGSKSPWTVTPNSFKPYLKPLFPTIYEPQEKGIVPWLEFKKRWYDESLERMGTGKPGSEFLKNLISYEFKQRNGPYDRWWYFEGKLNIEGKNSDIFETATFYHHLAYEVAYEMGIDVDNLISEGLALQCLELFLNR